MRTRLIQPPTEDKALALIVSNPKPLMSVGRYWPIAAVVEIRLIAAMTWG